MKIERKKMTMKIDKSFLEKEVIKIWNSCKEASESLKVSLSGIHNVLGQKCKSITVGGFLWEYLEVENIKYKK